MGNFLNNEHHSRHNLSVVDQIFQWVATGEVIVEVCRVADQPLVRSWCVYVPSDDNWLDTWEAAKGTCGVRGFVQNLNHWNKYWFYQYKFLYRYFYLSSNRSFSHKTLYLQRVATWVILTVVNRKLVVDDWRVHTGVNGAQAIWEVAVPVQSKVSGVEARPLSCAQIDLQSDHRGATVNCQIWVIYETQRKTNDFENLNFKLWGEINKVIEFCSKHYNMSLYLPGVLSYSDEQL